MALKLASLLCTCIINVVSKRDVHGSRNMFVSESCCRALGRAGTGCWCDACEHLKRDFRKAGYFFTGFGALNFPVSHREMPNFRAAFAFETFPSLCSMFLYCILSCHISTNPQNLLQLFILPKCPKISAISLFSLSFVQVLCDVPDWMKTHIFQLSDPKTHTLAENQRSVGCSQNHCPPHVQNHSQHPCCPWWISPLLTQPNPGFPS